MRTNYLFRGMARLVVVVWGVGLGSAVLAADASPAPSIPQPETLTKAEIRDLLSRMSDDDVRQLLLQQLDKTAKPDTGEPQASTDERLHRDIRLLDQRLTQLGEEVTELDAVGPFLVGKLSRDGTIGRFLVVIGLFGLVFAAAFVGEWLVRRRCLPVLEASGPADGRAFKEKLKWLTARAVLDALGLFVFVVLSVGVFLAIYDDFEPAREAFIALLVTIVATRVVHVGARFLFAPKTPAMRLLPMGNAVAGRLCWALVWVALAIAAASNLVRLLESYGFDPEAQRSLSVLLVWTIVVVFSGLLWFQRRLIARAMRGETGATSSQPSRFADNAYMLGVVYLMLMAVIASAVKLTTDAHILMPIIATTVLLFAIPLVDWIVKLALTAGIGRMVADADTAPEGCGDALLKVYVRPLHGNARIILAVVVVVLFAEIWRFDLEAIVAASLGERVASGLFEIVFTLILATAAWGMIKCALRHYAHKVDDAAGMAEAGEAGGKGKSRLATLIPLLGKFLLITLVVVVVLVVLSALGVNIGPLLAGAGVVGLAIGFGAQTLVKDIISGVFFLLDDAFRVGEYIDVGGVMGSVERISLRSLQLRHHRGPLNTIPFGEIKHLINYSRDWAIMKLELRVPFDTDLEKVRKIIKKVGQDMADDPVHGPHFLQPVKSQGVHRMDDSAFIVRVKFMAKPGEQFTLRREVFRRIQEAFSAEGIEFAPRRVIVDMGSTPATPAAMAAAAAADEKPPINQEQKSAPSKPA